MSFFSKFPNGWVVCITWVFHVFQIFITHDEAHGLAARWTNAARTLFDLIGR